MALSRRTGQRFQASIWPGFVDAMTGLLMVLIFVLTIFTLVQFVLRDTITGQESQLSKLTNEIASLADALGLEQDRAAQLGGQVAQLTGDLSDARDREAAQGARISALLRERDTLESALSDAQQQITGFEAQVAGLLADRTEARDKIATLEEGVADLRAREADLISEQEALTLALAQARSEVDAEAEAARLAAARRDALQALVADLQRQQAESAAELETAQTEQSQAQAALSEAEAARLAEAAAAQALRDKLAESDAELTAMTLALEEKRRAAEETLTLLAAARAAQGDRAAAQTEAERQAALLATAQQRLSEEQALSAKAQRDVEVLNQQTESLRVEVARLQELLGVAEAAESDAQVQITALGERLNTALARVAAEERRRAELEEAERLRLQEERDRLAQQTEDLEQYKSDFFGELRRVVADTPGVRVEGDRFVFSSEVLFQQGDAVLSEDGKRQIAQIAGTLRSIAGRIPEGIDWIIRVDGHTDNVPLSGLGEFADNWELSQARALSVVRFMSDSQGIPPQRLSANGFGEYRPLVAGDSAAARSANRRIELKLTER